MPGGGGGGGGGAAQVVDADAAEFLADALQQVADASGGPQIRAGQGAQRAGELPRVAKHSAVLLMREAVRRHPY